MATQRTRVYENWTSGVYGTRTDGEFTGYNVQVYTDGTLGERPGWRNLANDLVNSVPMDLNAADDELDTIMGLAVSDGSTIGTGTSQRFAFLIYDVSATNYKIVYATRQSQTQYRWSVTAAVTLTGGTPYDLTYAPALRSADGHTTLAGALPLEVEFNQCNNGVGPFSVLSGDDDSSIPTRSASGTELRVRTQYRDRAYYGGDDGRVWYSDPAASDTIPTTSFFVPAGTGEEGRIIGLWSVYSHLLIVTRGGRWFALSGASPETGSLREITKEAGPHTSGITVPFDNAVWYVSPIANHLGVVRATPEGVDTRSFRHLDPKANPARDTESSASPQNAVADDQLGYAMIHGIWDDDAALDAEYTKQWGLEYVNGVWTYAYYHFDSRDAADKCEAVFVSQGPPGVLGMAQAYTTQAGSFPTNRDLVLATRDYTLNRPGNTDDYNSTTLAAEAQTTTAQRAFVRLGAIRADADRILKPKKVVIEANYWKGTGYTAPAMTVVTKVAGLDADTSTATSSSFSVASTSWANAEGALRSIVVPVEDLPYGTEIITEITMNGFALERVKVYYEETPDVR